MLTLVIEGDTMDLAEFSWGAQILKIGPTVWLIYLLEKLNLSLISSDPTMAIPGEVDLTQWNLLRDTLLDHSL